MPKLPVFNINEEVELALSDNANEVASPSAMDVLKEIIENAIFLSGGDYRINEKFIEKAKTVVGEPEQ
jgi:hypothetical protein